MNEQSNKVDDLRKKFNEGGKNPNQILQPKPSTKFDAKPRPVVDNQLKSNTPTNNDWDAKDYMGSFEVPDQKTTKGEESHKYPKVQIAYGNINPEETIPDQQHNYTKYPKPATQVNSYGNLPTPEQENNYSKYPNPAHQNISYGNLPTPESKSYGNLPTPESKSYGNLPTPESKSYGNLPTPESKSYGNLPTPESKSYGNLPTPESKSYGNLPEPSTDLYGNLPASYGNPKPNYDQDDNIYDKPEVKSTRGILLKKGKKRLFVLDGIELSWFSLKKKHKRRKDF